MHAYLWKWDDKARFFDGQSQLGKERWVERVILIVWAICREIGAGDEGATALSAMHVEFAG